MECIFLIIFLIFFKLFCPISQDNPGRHKVPFVVMHHIYSNASRSKMSPYAWIHHKKVCDCAIWLFIFMPTLRLSWQRKIYHQGLLKKACKNTTGMNFYVVKVPLRLATNWIIWWFTQLLSLVYFVGKEVLCHHDRECRFSWTVLTMQLSKPLFQFLSLWLWVSILSIIIWLWTKLIWHNYDIMIVY